MDAEYYEYKMKLVSRITAVSEPGENIEGDKFFVGDKISFLEYLPNSRKFSKLRPLILAIVRSTGK